MYISTTHIIFIIIIRIQLRMTKLFIKTHIINGFDKRLCCRRDKTYDDICSFLPQLAQKIDYRFG